MKFNEYQATKFKGLFSLFCYFYRLKTKLHYEDIPEITEGELHFCLSRSNGEQGQDVVIVAGDHHWYFLHNLRFYHFRFDGEQYQREHQFTR
jgi:hypothetical protein